MESDFAMLRRIAETGKLEEGDKERLLELAEVRAFFKGFNNCRSQFLKNISERSGIDIRTVHPKSPKTPKTLL